MNDRTGWNREDFERTCDLYLSALFLAALERHNGNMEYAPQQVQQWMNAALPQVMHASVQRRIGQMLATIESDGRVH